MFSNAECFGRGVSRRADANHLQLLCSRTLINHIRSSKIIQASSRQVVLGDGLVPSPFQQSSSPPMPRNSPTVAVVLAYRSARFRPGLLMLIVVLVMLDICFRNRTDKAPHLFQLLSRAAIASQDADHYYAVIMLLLDHPHIWRPNLQASSPAPGFGSAPAAWRSAAPRRAPPRGAAARSDAAAAAGPGTQVMGKSTGNP